MRKFILTNLAIAGLLLAAVLWPVSAKAGFAPERPTFQCVTKWQCPGSSYVTFNSFIDNPNYGDERDFFRAKDAGTANNEFMDRVNAGGGQRFTMQILVHNDANPNAIGVDEAMARNTRLQVVLPGSEAAHSEAAAYITADNARPMTVSDTVTFSGQSPFHVSLDTSQPVYMTKRANNGDGDFFSVPLGNVYHSANGFSVHLGDWQGGFKHHGKVTFTVMIQTAHVQPTDTALPANQTVTQAIACENLDITMHGRGMATVTARAATQSTNFSGYSFTVKDSSGAVIDKRTTNWGGSSSSYHFNQPDAGIYTVTVQAVDASGQPYGQFCTKELLVEERAVVLQAGADQRVEKEPPAEKGPSALPSTGASAAALFTGVSALAGAGHFFFRRITG